jgi:hypothetical protein
MITADILSLFKGKFQVQSLVQNFIPYVERQHNVVIKIVRTDNGPEFAPRAFFAEKGIIHQISCVETPEQNARVERKDQFILSIACALMCQSSCQKSYGIMQFNMMYI